jgi:hypothetical protein
MSRPLAELINELIEDQADQAAEAQARGQFDYAETLTNSTLEWQAAAKAAGIEL